MTFINQLLPLQIEKPARPDDSPSSAVPLAGLTAVYLVAPIFLFAWSWLKWPFALAVTLMAGCFVLVALRDAWHAHNRTSLWKQLRPLWPALGILCAWLLLSGIGGFGSQVGDYEANNALFLGLVDGNWPLQIAFKGQTVYVVYYMAYFLPAAGIGKLFGWAAANVFILVWALCGILLAFAWFRRMLSVRARVWPLLLAALVFCLASGMDSVGYYLFQGNPFEWGKHLENWATLFQFSSQTSLLYWVPQQALAAWLMAGLTFGCLDDPRLFRYLGMSIAAGILWSPFGVLGVAPYVLAVGITLVARKQARVLFAPLPLGMNLAALGIGAIHLLYISSNQYNFPTGMLWKLAEDRRASLTTAAEFWLVEFGLLAVCALLLDILIRRLHKANKLTGSGDALPRGWLWLVCLILSGLPLFKMGYNNDIVMRASIPSLFFFWAFVSQVLLETGLRLKTWRIRLVRALLIGLLLVGSYTSLSEIGRLVTLYHFGPPASDTVKPIANANADHIVAQRIGNSDSLFFRLLGR
jgi:hypothetical protein